MNTGGGKKLEDADWAHGFYGKRNLV